MDILCGKTHWIVSLGGWLAAEAVLLQTLCSIAGWTFYAVKYTGLYRWVGGWQAGEAVLLQTLCSIAGWTFNAVKYTGLYSCCAPIVVRVQQPINSENYGCHLRDNKNILAKCPTTV